MVPEPADRRFQSEGRNALAISSAVAATRCGLEVGDTLLLIGFWSDIKHEESDLEDMVV